ncbi:hypothetical protein PTT_10406 [Pyrenophora teres f. teres 0-1]|uniref:Uncharacterized protein n=1 Tax=Pyrenophora teres f. teres (strain 0-1) TaxID=861557 RepID=E3RP72_PYRTT|nr:hypothetical protein PTT_10406 [Pyrenophora teres f. teres 0-1]
MAKLPFPAYGSLYFADAPIEQSLKSGFVKGFCIGPHCGPQYWNCNAGETRFYERKPPNRGPWNDLESYCSGLINTGFSRVPNDDDSQVDILLYRGSVKEHLRLLEDPAADVPILEKLVQGEAPDIEPSRSVSMEDPEEEAARKRYEKNVSTCQQTYEVVLRGFVPKIHNARAMDETLLRPFRYCDTSWRDSAAALRQELIDISQRWTELGLPGSCPYQPTPEELREHEKQYEDFQTVQQLKLFLKRALDAESDGWIPADQWAAKVVENRKLFGEFLESVKESGGSEECARALWPFGEFGSPQ